MVSKAVNFKKNDLIWVEGNLFVVVREEVDPLSDLLICTNGHQVMEVKKEGCEVVGFLSSERLEMAIAKRFEKLNITYLLNKEIGEMKGVPNIPENLFPSVDFSHIESASLHKICNILNQENDHPTLKLTIMNQGQWDSCGRHSHRSNCVWSGTTPGDEDSCNEWIEKQTHENCRFLLPANTFPNRDNFPNPECRRKGIDGILVSTEKCLTCQKHEFEEEGT